MFLLVIYDAYVRIHSKVPLAEILVKAKGTFERILMYASYNVCKGWQRDGLRTALDLAQAIATTVLAGLAQ